jgi:putative ABC transport system ATP-binding protein
MADKPLIKLENIYKEYVNDEVVTKVLHDVSLELQKGEFVAIMGPSGSGKSTLMHIMGFLDKLSQGKYNFKGEDVSELEDDELAEIRNREVGFIFQAFNLLQRTSIFDNVKLPLTYSSKNLGDNDVIKAIKSVGLYHRIGNLSNQLSGGEKQRVAIARALVNQPEIIFADEPTGNLDSKSGKQVMEILQDLNEEGKTIILVTHEKYTAEHARRIINIVDGKIVKDYEVQHRLIAKNEKKLTK